MANGALNPVMLRGTANLSGGAVSGYAFVDQSGNVSVNASVVATANISGQPVNLVSGTGPISIMSGLYLASGISIAGNFSTTVSSGLSLASGLVPNISGQSVALYSGSNNVREVGSTIINSNLSGAYIITGNSGGSVLFSAGPLISATLRSASGNTVMFIAGLGNNVPSNNVGIPLYGNETLTFKVANFNAISAFASTSGQILNYVGLQ